MEHIKIPAPLVYTPPARVNCKFEIGSIVEEYTVTVVSTQDAPGQGKYFSAIKLDLFDRKLFVGGDFFANWRNVYRHPIIWFLSK